MVIAQHVFLFLHLIINIFVLFVVVKMVQKRPFNDEELYKVSSKHPRQLEHNNELVPFLEFVPSELAFQKLFFSAESGSTKIDKIEGDEKIAIATDSIVEPPASIEDTETSVPGCLSWATSSTSEEDARSEAVLHEPFSPNYFDPDRSTRTFARSEEYYSYVDQPSRRRIPIGPGHQADIPTWGLQGTGGNDEKRFMGNCVIPMPDSEAQPTAHDTIKAVSGRTDCSCRDKGSLQCVRQHVAEAREELMKTLGQERFVELGFCNMGEKVAENWSDDEERLFHEVVFSNPASLGKSFWENLSIVFPFKAKKEIVSYYFNVFMLQRRAEQNRYDPVNIDSDNDEWQESDNSGDELGMTEEDEDSVVESPIYHDIGYTQSWENDVREYDEDAVGEICDNNGSVVFGSFKGINNIAETCLGKLSDNCSSDPTFPSLEKIPREESDYHEAQDESCTSFDTGVPAPVTEVKAEDGNHWPGSPNGFSNGSVRGYVLEPCDAKVWETGSGYITCPKNEIDFLPTYSVIEEVFGVGTWNCKARDGKGLS
ncbi:uncharacterized protein LOC131146099 isoform X2 [Malania oleifera]|uniref:uncharacterized protein LOC131146099 isoform X2 n=2 Tax=Malania oleifera TaxID=397392 RepID=UPI0025AE85F5|nr:uncharacterized protein LOC131146099 isoform X2 [Malania oleifera]